MNKEEIARNFWKVLCITCPYNTKGNKCCYNPMDKECYSVTIEKIKSKRKLAKH